MRPPAFTSSSSRPTSDLSTPGASPSRAADVAPAQDHTVAMPRGGWTPSAPPIAFGPVVHASPSAAPPANVRTRPPSVAPPAVAQQQRTPSIAIGPAASAQAPGVLGLILFAAPLAFATMAVATLALL